MLTVMRCTRLYGMFLSQERLEVCGCVVRSRCVYCMWMRNTWMCCMFQCQEE